MAGNNYPGKNDTTRNSNDENSKQNENSNQNDENSNQTMNFNPIVGDSPVPYYRENYYQMKRKRDDDGDDDDELLPSTPRGPAAGPPHLPTRVQGGPLSILMNFNKNKKLNMSTGSNSNICRYCGTMNNEHWKMLRVSNQLGLYFEPMGLGSIRTSGVGRAAYESHQYL